MANFTSDHSITRKLVILDAVKNLLANRRETLHGVHTQTRKMVVAKNRIQRTPHLTEQVYAALCQAITRGELAPGQLLIIDRLAADLGVSQTPVREALARLLQKGIVIEAPGGKLQVIPLTEGYVSETFLVRGALEGLAVELATPRLSIAQLEALDQMLQDSSTALAEDNDAAYIQSDGYLHRLIWDTSGNTMLHNELESLEIHIDFIRSYSQRRSGTHIRASHQEHLQILAALQRRDPLAARQAMEQHIRSTSARIVKLIDFYHPSGGETE
jgi:DNA-binding GntR family transcriptional regulator